MDFWSDFLNANVLKTHTICGYNITYQHGVVDMAQSAGLSPTHDVVTQNVLNPTVEKKVKGLVMTIYYYYFFKFWGLHYLLT